MTIETPIGQKLYWDYLCYVKEHPINTWNIDTYIMYGTRMNCANLKLLTILQKHRCELEVVETGEHYFHTAEQLKIFQQWLHKHIN